ncbi:MAG: SpoIIE family protein phosphatase [Candidatus Eisenbacteria bacterium]
MDEARLVVPQPGGFRTVPVTKFPFRLGRHHENELVLSEADVSRHHAEVLREGERYFVADTNSRFGTYLNGEKIDRGALVHGDQIQLGSPNHPPIEFQLVSAEMSTGKHEIAGGDTRTLAGSSGQAAAAAAIAEANAPARPRGAMGMLGQALRAMVEGRVLEEVLAIVVDHAIALAGAERGFVMMANKEGELDVRMARGRKNQTLPGRDFKLSRSVPKQVFETGKLVYENEVPDSRHTQMDLKIRSILCAPLPRVRTAEFDTGDTAAQAAARKPMGVLYVDSAGLGQLEAGELHATFEQLAAEAAVAIENARLVRDSEEKIKLERELSVAADIQRALLPPRRFSTSAIELAGTTIPCRAIGGDFYEYIEFPDGRLGFALCDVAGKGPGAALLAAAIQGILASSAQTLTGPGEAMARLNQTLLRRSVDRRFATIAYGVIDAEGRMRLTSAGHNPAYLLTAGGEIRKLDRGGLMVGAFPGLSYDEDEVTLAPGDRLILYSDGVTEAEDSTTEQFEEKRLEDCLRAAGPKCADDLVSHVIDGVNAFANGYQQADDITVLVVGYLGSAPPAG